jgi:hypothetical protein
MQALRCVALPFLVTSPALPVFLVASGVEPAAASKDATAKVWDAQTGQETLTLKGHAGATLACASARTASAWPPPPPTGW